jgi:hypothetical protein
MTTVKIQSDIDSNGFLRLDVPVGLPAGRAEVVVVVQPGFPNGGNQTAPVARTARSGMFVGITKQVDVDLALKEITEIWESGLSELP